MENCACRQNIRIVGIKEKAENGRLSDFFVNIASYSFCSGEHFSVPIRIDSAFWSAKPCTDCKPWPTVRFHHLAVKEHVLKLARESSGLRYDNSPVFIYPDMLADILRRCWQFTAIKEKCKARTIWYGFRHLAKFIVTVGDRTETFDSLEDASKFLTERVTGTWQNTTLMDNNEQACFLSVMLSSGLPTYSGANKYLVNH